MQTLVREGVALAYEEAGRGGPPLLLVHGWAGDHRHMEPLFEHFRATHRVVSVDRRGHGASDPSPNGYAIQTFVDDLAWMTDALGLYRPLVVVHSQDAIALDLAARYPALPLAIAILDGPTLAPAPVVEQFRSLQAALHSPAYREAIRAMAEQIIAPDPEDPQRREQLMERMLSLPQEVLASTWDAYVEYDAAQAAAQCKVPVLHVGGVFPADLERLQSLCPQLVTSHVDGAGHFIQLHATPQVIDELERFLTLVHEPASV